MIADYGFTFKPAPGGEAELHVSTDSAYVVVGITHTGALVAAATALQAAGVTEASFRDGRLYENGKLRVVVEP